MLAREIWVGKDEDGILDMVLDDFNKLNDDDLTKFYQNLRGSLSVILDVKRRGGEVFTQAIISTTSNPKL